MNMALLIGGMVVGVFVICLTIAAFFQVAWFYSVGAIILTCSAILLIRLLWRKTATCKNQTQNIERATTVSNIILTISAIMIIVGVAMFIFCFLSGPTSYANSFTLCGWCGGSGILSNGKQCSLCDGGGGASSSSARYTATESNWLGVLIAASGIAIVISTKSYMKKYG